MPSPPSVDQSNNSSQKTHKSRYQSPLSPKIRPGPQITNTRPQIDPPIPERSNHDNLDAR